MQVLQNEQTDNETIYRAGIALGNVVSFFDRSRSSDIRGKLINIARGPIFAWKSSSRQGTSRKGSSQGPSGQVGREAVSRSSKGDQWVGGVSCRQC